jgi:hypothetical protein
VQRDLLVQTAGMDARTAELRERIAPSSRLSMIVALLLRR